MSNSGHLVYARCCPFSCILPVIDQHLLIESDDSRLHLLVTPFFA